MTQAAVLKTLSVTDQDKLRAWLVLLNNSNGLKKSIDGRLKTQFGVSISRFDVLAALERGGSEGLRAGELTKKLVVSDGNTTQVTNKLVRDGLVVRRTGRQDRRCVIYALTDEGARVFKAMAVHNKKWISSAFSDFSKDDLQQLTYLLGKLKVNAPQ